METKLLKKLILDDIKILEKLISSLNNNINNPEGIEIAINRAKSLTKELELLSRNISFSPQHQSLGKRIPSKKETLTDDPEQLSSDNIPNKKNIILPPVVQERSDIVEESQQKPEPSKKERTNIQEEFAQNSRPKTLGESLGEKQQLVNDLHIKNSEDSNIVNTPLKSIRDGIGINDRFLFIRELFDNDNKKFEEVVKTLDNCNSINEAVDYLKTNFRWKNSETSKKFLSLIKRKFTN